MLLRKGAPSVLFLSRPKICSPFILMVLRRLSIPQGMSSVFNTERKRLGGKLRLLSRRPFCVTPGTFTHHSLARTCHMTMPACKTEWEFVYFLSTLYCRERKKKRRLEDVWSILVYSIAIADI